jgi:hypothetical protein
VADLGVLDTLNRAVGTAHAGRHVNFSTHRAVAAFCIAIVAIGVLLPPGLDALDATWFELGWVLLPPAAALATPSPLAIPREQPLALFSLAAARAPPSSVPLITLRVRSTDYADDADSLRSGPIRSPGAPRVA